MSARRASQRREKRRTENGEKAYTGPVLRSGEFIVVGEDTYELTIPKTAVSDDEWLRLIAEGWRPDERR